MGNSCCGIYKSSSSSIVWAAADDDDDDWISVSEASDNSINKKPIGQVETQSLLELNKSSSSFTHDTYSREVKIKISKKELEELVGRGDHVHGSIQVDQVLSRLLKLKASHMINHCYYDQRSVWRPILQTIPELN